MKWKKTGKEGKKDLSPAERYLICRECDRFFAPTRQCKECGCFLALKVKVKSQSCPLGKW
jgi:hypothetical protein